MEIIFLEYPKCTTCKKAKDFLTKNNIVFTQRHIVEDNPNKEELKKWIKFSGLPIKRFFNTSGIKYRKLNLKDKFEKLSEENLLTILESDGMLVKRPLIISDKKIIVGFKPDEYEKLL
ncbi:MAG: arsenate reductase family protein [Bacilli bacterium]